MIHTPLLSQDWQLIVTRLGGAAAIETSARQAKAFLRARVISNAVDLLRLILAYCLGQGGLRSTAAWPSAIGLVDIANVALLQRLSPCRDRLGALGCAGLLRGARPDRRRRLGRRVAPPVAA